ncbi:unnamed protein product [Merluccius merluccius]
MNPSPDRGKECLPPKKRESRQGSVEQQHQAPPADDFKPPVPVRIRPGAARGEGSRDASDGSRPLIKQNRHLLTSPPALHAHAPAVPLQLPWHVHFPPPMTFFPGQMGGERRGSGSPSWRDDPLCSSSSLSNHSRWLRGEGVPALPAPQHSSVPSPSFKTPNPSDSREMWPYFNSAQREYSSDLFSPSQLFSHPSLPPDAGLAEARDRYLVKRPNGLDGPGSRTAPASRLALLGDYMNDRTRINISPHGPHANGGRRQQEQEPCRTSSGGVFFPSSQPQEGPEIHSSLQNTPLMGKASPGLFPASPNHLGPDPRAERVGLLEAPPLGVPPSEAQIYYSQGSVQQSSLQPPSCLQPQAQAFTFASSETPLYNRLKEPRLRQHSLSLGSPLFSHRLPSNHDRSHKEQEPDHGRDRERDSLSALRQREHKAADSERVREKEAERARDHNKGEREREGKDAERDGERERRRTRDRIGERDRSRVREGFQTPASAPASQPSPPTFLPHFTKGSQIRLASGHLKCVEEFRTEDFLRSADTSPEIHLSTCTVTLIAPGNAHGFNHLQVHLNDRNTQELLNVLGEYPFFVWDRGWSSCCPPRTMQLYGLSCRQLAEGDVCLVLTPTPAPANRTQALTCPGSRRTPRSQMTGQQGARAPVQDPGPGPTPSRARRTIPPQSTTELLFKWHAQTHLAGVAKSLTPPQTHTLRYALVHACTENLKEGPVLG